MREPGPSDPGSTNLPVQPPILDPEAAFRHRKSRQVPAVPTREGIAAALSGHTAPDRSGLGMPYGGRQTTATPRTYDAPRWFLSVSPGTVRVHRRLVAPKEPRWEDDDVTLTEGRAGKPIVSWSEKSRANMTATLPSYDYSPMFADGRPTAMVTLTLPGQDWERLVPDLATFKKAVDRFQQQYQRAWGARPVAVWKMEFQRRGAPHLHLFMVPPAGLSKGRRLRPEAGFSGGLGGLTFQSWLGPAWAKIIDPAMSGVGFRDHAMYGTGIDYREGERFSDPRRIAVYFSKHGAFSEKDYQNDIPEHWRAKIIEDGGGGARFWGAWQLSKAVHTVELNVDPMVRRSAPLDGEPVREFRERVEFDLDGNPRTPHYVRTQ